MNRKPFDLEERLVAFAGGMALFLVPMIKHPVIAYYGDQLIRSSGSAALNFGEGQGAVSNKDKIFKYSLVLKELKESRVALKILIFTKLIDARQSQVFLQECEELIAIVARIILNKKRG